MKSNKKSQTEYRHGDLKAAMMAAALDKVAKTGEVEFSLRELSQKVGVTHAAAYRHFSSKKDILLAISKEGHDILSESFRKVLDSDPKDIEALGWCYVRFATKHPNHFKIMFHPDVKVEDESNDDPGQKTFSYLLASVEENKKQGLFSRQDSHLIAMSAWAAVHGLSMLIVNENLQSKMNADSEKMAKVMTSNMMNGFLKR